MIAPEIRSRDFLAEENERVGAELEKLMQPLPPEESPKEKIEFYVEPHKSK